MDYTDEPSAIAESKGIPTLTLIRTTTESGQAIMTDRPWEADPAARLVRRWGKAAIDLDPPQSGNDPGCPDIWELDNGDVAVIGRDLTTCYASILPDGVTIAHDEKLVIIPRATIIAAKTDIPDA